MTIDHRLRLALILLVAVVATATVYYMISESWGIIDALYFSVATATTVGYGDVVPTHPASKLFTTIYMVVSTGLVLYSIGMIAQKRFLIHLGLHKKHIEQKEAQRTRSKKDNS